MAEGVLLSPTFPPGTGGLNPAIMASGGGFDRVRKTMIRKTVDYHCSVLRYLENRVWQRDNRDKPVIQPDPSYFNEVVVPQGFLDSPVNAVTTKFVKACTNKARSPIFCTAWVPDGRRLVTGAASGEFTLWNGINFNFESIIQAHDCSVRSMNWSHSGKWMVTTDDRGFIKYWQINFNNVHTFQAHSEPVRGSSFSPTDSKLATCSDDGTVRIFDFLSCTEEHLLRGHGADVKCIHWHPTKSLLVSGSKDNQQPVKLWDPKAGQSVCTIHAHKATVMDVKWNPNGNWFGTASRDHLIKIYDIRMMKELWVLKGHKKDVNTLSWHPVHEKVFASGGSDGAILFWTIGVGREIGGMESAHEGFVWSLSWHPLGHLLCSGANDHTCKFWCRNRPGEEIKDKYNTFHNPFFGGEEDTLSYPMPGMGLGHGGVSLPPPSHAINLPPPTMGNTWKPHAENPTIEDTLTSPKHNVPVLGADIIAQTFAEKRIPDDHHAANTPTESQNQLPEQTPGNFHGPARDYNHLPGMLPRGSIDGHPPPPAGPGGYRGPPPDDGQGGYNPFSWHNPEVNPRHSGFEDELRWPNQGNRFVYRRNDGPSDSYRRSSMDKEQWRYPRKHGEEFNRGYSDGQFDQQEPGNHRSSQWESQSNQWGPPGNQDGKDRLQETHGQRLGGLSPHHDLRGPPPGQLPHDFHGSASRIPHPPQGASSYAHDIQGPHDSPQMHGQSPGDPPSRGPPVLHNIRGPPLSHDPRGPPHDSRGPLPPHNSRRPHPSHDPRGPPSHDLRGPPPPHDKQGLLPRGPPQDSHGPPPHQNPRGPSQDLPPSNDHHGAPFTRDPHGPLLSPDNQGPLPHNPRAPPLSYDPRGPPPHDSRGPPLSHDHRGPPHDSRGPPPSHDPRGPPHDSRGPPPSHDPRGPPHDSRGPPPSHDPRGPPHDSRGPPPSHDPRGPPHDSRGPPPSHDPRGPPHDSRGPPPSHDPRGPPHDSRGPPPSHDPRGPPHDSRGPPPSHDPRGPPHDSHGPPPSHDPRGPPHDSRGPPPSHDPRGPPNDSRGPPPSHDPRGPPHDSRGPPPSHDPRGPPRGGPPSHDPRGPSHDSRGPPLSHDSHIPPPSHDPRGPPHDSRGPPSHDSRGLLPSHDLRGPPHDSRGPPQSHDSRGTPPSQDPHGPPLSHDPRGPPLPHDSHGPPQGHDPRGPPPHDSHDPRRPPHDSRGLPPSHDPRGPPPPHDPRGPSFPHNSRGPPPHDSRGTLSSRGPPSRDPRGPPSHDPPFHDSRVPPRESRGPHSSFESRGPPNELRGTEFHSHPMHERVAHHDMNGQPHYNQGGPPDSRGTPYTRENEFRMDQEQHMHQMQTQEKEDSLMHNRRGPLLDQRGLHPHSPSSQAQPNKHFSHPEDEFLTHQGPPSQKPPSDPRMSHVPGSQPSNRSHRPPPPPQGFQHQGYQGSPSGQNDMLMLGSHETQFDRRGGGWHSSNRSGRDERRKEMMYNDDRRDGGRGRGRDGSPLRRGSSDDNPPAKRARN